MHDYWQLHEEFERHLEEQYAIAYSMIQDLQQQLDAERKRHDDLETKIGKFLETKAVEFYRAVIDGDEEAINMIAKVLAAQRNC